jgi:Protein of unknown function (DUF3987)
VVPLNAAEIRSALACGRQGCECAHAGGVKTHCPGPSHRNGDRKPSLGIDEKDGKILVRCYAGCDQAAVVSALQARDLWPRQDGVRGQQEPTRIVATYDYRDASGGLSFQVVRMHPKDFRQRKPKAGGGWEWRAGDRSLVYRLPELLASSDADIVFLPEGEKDVDRLRTLGLVAVTNAGGGKKWSDGNSRWLAGRRVAILPDNDETGEKDGALKLRSLATVAECAAIVTLEGLPPAGDVSDWLDAGGSKERLIALAEAALASAPTAEKASSSAVPPPALIVFPIHVLPPSMRGLVTSGCAAMGVPAEFIAVPLLVLAGAVVGNAWEIEIKGGWYEGPNLYAAIVGDPGAKKTPALKLALRAIHQIQERLYGEYRAAKAAYDEEYALWEKTPKKERGAPPEQPKFQHVWTSDSTTEALAEMLAGSKGLALFRDELVGWVKSMDQYRSGKGADRQHYLSMWSRTSIKIDRKSTPIPIIVPRPCLSVVGGIQPDVLTDLQENAARDDGFVDRLLFAYPDLGPDRWTSAGIDEAAQVAVERLFSALYDLKGVTAPDGTLAPRRARLDADAMRLWGQWYDANAEEVRDDRMPSNLRGTWSKLPSQLARLVLILHLGYSLDAGATVGATIPRSTLEAACDLLDYFREHARAVLGELRTPRSQLEERVLKGLRDRGPSTTRTVYLEILNGAVKYDRVKVTLERLLEDGSVVATDGVATGKGGRPGRIWSAVETEATVTPRRFVDAKGGLLGGLLVGR